MTPYYDVDGITIFCDDCLKVMPHLEPPFDMILADLPYGTTACEWDSIIPLEPLWVEYKRLIKDRGAIVLTGQEPFASIVRCNQFNLYRYDWYLRKHKPTNPQQMKNRPGKIIEVAMVFYKQLGTYNPQKERRISKKVINKPSKHATFGALSGNTTNRIIPYNDDGTRFPVQLIPFGKIPLGTAIHETQKPVALFAYLIRTYTNPGELILDNVIGSGTTLVAAQNEGRRAVGIELSEEYCKIAVDRLRQKSLFSIIKPEPKQPEAEQLEL